MAGPFLVIVAVVIALGCGFKKLGSNGNEEARRRPSRARSVRQARAMPEGEVQVLEVGRPAGESSSEVQKLLADLASGDLVRAWQAEARLKEMGPGIAAEVRQVLDSPSPEARAAGCRLAYHYRDLDAVPGIIRLLDDSSDMVRTQADVSLSGITGQDFNFRAEALRTDRLAAQKRWSNWYAKTYGNQARRR